MEATPDAVIRFVEESVSAMGHELNEEGRSFLNDKVAAQFDALKMLGVLGGEGVEGGDGGSNNVAAWVTCWKSRSQDQTDEDSDDMSVTTIANQHGPVVDARVPRIPIRFGGTGYVCSRIPFTNCFWCVGTA